MEASRRAFVKGAAFVGGAGGVVSTASARSLLDVLPAQERTAIVAGASDYDCGPAIRTIMAEGGTVFLPAGRYVVKTPMIMVPHVTGRFAPGIAIAGEGPGRTIIEDRTQNRALFDFDSGADPSTGFRAIRGVHLAGFTIDGTRAGRGTAAIRLRGCFQSSLRDLHVTDRRGTGIVIPCLFGDIDGSNMVELVRVSIENCGGWGIDAAAAAGRNEISYLMLRHVIVQGCGTAGSSPIPESGGMRYKGQVLELEQCAFTLNRNVGLLIPGEAGLAINIQLSSTTFENNLGRHLLCTGVSVLTGRNLQFFSNDEHRIAVACEFVGDHYTVREVVLEGVTVRASAGNTPYTCFRFTGSNLDARTCRVSNVAWADFGSPGQSRVAGEVSVDG